MFITHKISGKCRFLAGEFSGSWAAHWVRCFSSVLAASARVAFAAILRDRTMSGLFAQALMAAFSSDESVRSRSVVNGSRFKAAHKCSSLLRGSPAKRVGNAAPLG